MTELEDRVRSRLGDSPEQRLHTFRLRAHLGFQEHNKWSDEEIAVEYGTFPDLVREVRA